MKRSSLQTLARMHRWDLDQLRREAGALQRQRAELVERDLGLAARIEQERQVAAGAGEYADFGVFAQGIKEQRRRIAGSVAELDAVLDVMQERIMAAYQEMKRYETLEERLRERARKRAAQREQAQLDEIGLTVHRRRPSPAS